MYTIDIYQWYILKGKAGHERARRTRKFGDSLMSKTDTAMTNEVLCKILCHNLTCLIQEQETLGITPIFWKDEQLADGEKPAILPMIAQYEGRQQ